MLEWGINRQKWGECNILGFLGHFMLMLENTGYFTCYCSWIKVFFYQPFLSVSSLFVCVPSGVYILIGAGSLVMLVGFFGCCGAVRESQCLLGSVSTNARTEMLIIFSSSWKSTYIDTYIFFTSTVHFSVLRLSADHLRCWGGSGGVWIPKQRQGTFIILQLE